MNRIIAVLVIALIGSNVWWCTRPDPVVDPVVISQPARVVADTVAQRAIRAQRETSRQARAVQSMADSLHDVARQVPDSIVQQDSTVHRMIVLAEDLAPRVRELTTQIDRERELHSIETVALRAQLDQLVEQRDVAVRAWQREQKKPGWRGVFIGGAVGAIVTLAIIL